MARNDMTAQLIPHLQRPFKVQTLANLPIGQVGFRHGLGADFDVKPVARRSAQRDHGQADAFAGDRSANVDAAGVISGADPGAQITLLLQLQYLAHIGDNAGEHLRFSFAPWVAAQASARNPARIET